MMAMMVMMAMFVKLVMTMMLVMVVMIAMMAMMAMMLIWRLDEVAVRYSLLKDPNQTWHKVLRFATDGNACERTANQV